MSKHKNLAVSNAAQRAGQIAIPGLAGRAVAALEKEAARIVAEDAEKRLNGGTSLHLVGSGGHISGFIKDKHTTVQFAGGSVAIHTHD
jgi:hypothetical protein